LARVLVRVAGFVYRPRGDQWKADLRYVQQVEEESGLLPAGWCLMSAPWLVLCHVLALIRQRALVAAVTGAVVAASLAFSLIQPKTYTAAARLLVKPPLNQVVLQTLGSSSHNE